MAPPSPRRPGFSRRAQYGLFAGYVVAVIGALVALLLIAARSIGKLCNSGVSGGYVCANFQCVPRCRAHGAGDV
jgi:hypothetical protein